MIGYELLAKVNQVKNDRQCSCLELIRLERGYDLSKSLGSHT